MFGHNEDEQDTQNQSSVAVPAEPVASGVPPTEDNSNGGSMFPSKQEPEEEQAEQLETPVDAPNKDDDLFEPADELLTLKQAALEQLNPLVGHLDQTPEEKFRTLMMMIQATDDHSKLKETFEAAKEITDDKARAQALLDVINEINYFTQTKDA